MPRLVTGTRVSYSHSCSSRDSVPTSWSSSSRTTRCRSTTGRRSGRTWSSRSSSGWRRCVEHPGRLWKARSGSVASLDRARTIETTVGTFAVHHLPPALFGGWEETPYGPVATPVKAIFDLCYVTAAHRGRLPHLPELELPDLQSVDQFEPWLSRIASRRVRSITEAGLRRAIDRVRAS
jgi:hypothetical protein